MYNFKTGKKLRNISKNTERINRLTYDRKKKLIGLGRNEIIVKKAITNVELYRVKADLNTNLVNSVQFYKNFILAGGDG